MIKRLVIANAVWAGLENAVKEVCCVFVGRNDHALYGACVFKRMSVSVMHCGLTLILAAILWADWQ